MWPAADRSDASAKVWIRVAEPLRIFLPARDRYGVVGVLHDPETPLRHTVPAVGIPLTEVGELRADGQGVVADHRLGPGTTVDVDPVRRPQPVVAMRFLLDVHFGALARRMRLLGVDTAYRNDATDDALVAAAIDGRRVLLTQDRGLLRRRALAPPSDVAGRPIAQAAHICGRRWQDQLCDVLDRFDPPLAPYTLCTACGGTLRATSKASVAHLIEPGTRRTYRDFVQCRNCGQVYWHGAHGGRLEAIVASVTTRHHARHDPNRARGYRDGMAENRNIDDELWGEFHRVVNMSSGELEAWLLTDGAGEYAEQMSEDVGPPAGQHVLRILDKRRTDLTDDDVRLMQKVVDRVHAQRRDDLEPEQGDADWRHRLMSMGHDPLKPAPEDL